jgi:hypothetical protein
MKIDAQSREIPEAQFVKVVCLSGGEDIPMPLFELTGLNICSAISNPYHSRLVAFDAVSILGTEEYVPADPRLFNLAAGNKWGWLMSVAPAICPSTTSQH